jgi:hypothetical protein
VATPDRLRQRVRRLHRRGVTYSQIARTLNDEGLPTAQGGRRWYLSTVRALVRGRQTASEPRTRRRSG